MSVPNQWAVTTGLTESAKPLDFKDRSTGLAIFGTLQLAMGGLAALMVPLMLLSLAVSPQSGGTSAAQMIPAAVAYSFVAVAFATLGVGSIRARRWARALTLVLAWMWLAVGIISLVSMILFIPNMTNMLSTQKQASTPMMMNAVFVMMIIMMTFIYVVVPGVFIIFYGRYDVKATCEWRDPQIRWTDRCPLPVLSLSLMLGFAATSVLWSAGYGFVAPFFGIILKGVAGAILFMGISLLFGYLAWATYKQKIAAWWTTLGTFLLLGLSTIISFSAISLMDLYREMGFPKDQLDMMERSGAFGMNLPLMMGINLLVFVGYLFWVRGYFDVAVDPPSPPPSSPDPPSSNPLVSGL